MVTSLFLKVLLIGTAAFSCMVDFFFTSGEKLKCLVVDGGRGKGSSGVERSYDEFV